MSHRNDTVVDYQERIVKALVYLQEHMDEPVSLEELAKVACFSPFHFHRIFSAFVGETMFQYTRRIRLERAAHWLVNSSKTITEIALDSGYKTPAAFGKAFQKQFQKNPTQFKKEGRAIRHKMLMDSLPMIEEKSMTPTIQELPEQRLLFVRKIGMYSDASQEAWKALMTFAIPKGIISESTQFIGISHDNPNVTKPEHCRYDACISVGEDVEGEGEVGIQTISEGKFAIFLHEGAYDGLKHTYQAIFSQWLPASGETLREIPCFESYLNNVYETPPEDLRTEIYIPLQ